MLPTIKTLSPKKLISKSLMMNLIENKTAQLWQSFGPRIKEITNRVTNDKISLQIYPENYFKQFNPKTEFTKYACVEVTDYNDLPNDLETLDLEAGLYAVFNYKGSSADKSIFQYIFSEWLPNSDFYLDHRPHFEVLGEKYKNNDPNSEEEIWIPIKNR